jgi:hypothetical protein
LQPLALFLSARGRLAPGLFAGAIIAVYLASFLSQFLISRPVLAQAGPAPFALVQGLATWSWLCLHAKRLRDSGTGTGAATAIAILYGLAALLFMLIGMLIGALMSKDATLDPSADFADWFTMFLFMAMLVGEPNAGLFRYVALTVMLLGLVPVIMAVAFSVFAFRRPSAKHVPAPSP